MKRNDLVETRKSTVNDMKTTSWLLCKNGMLITVSFLMMAAHGSSAAAQTIEKHTEVIGRITCYAVKPASRENFQKALSDYVLEAITREGSIQAEAYSERNNLSVMWLIERWRSKSELEHFSSSPQSKAVDSLKGEALATGPETYFVTDLEPISEEQWRRVAKKEDRPLTVMLFVDSKEGTEKEFKTTYHEAMPHFRSEPGVVTYQLSQVVGCDTKFVTYEKFRSEEAFQYHLNFDPVKPVIAYLEKNSQKQPFQKGLHILIEFAPLIRE